MAQIYKKTIQIRFGDADPARILYFANLLSISHDCFEDFIQANGYEWKEWFRDNSHMVPIRHAECDYRSPFIPGEHYEIQVQVAQIKETSLQMQYTYVREGKTHAIVKIVHAFLDSKTKQKTSVPEKVKRVFSPFLVGTT